MKSLVDIVNKWEIPKISEERLNELSMRIKPVVVNPNKNNKLYYIEDVNPSTTSFTWEATFTKKAKKISKLTSVFSLHSSYPGLWKPSLKEILAFIQDHHLINDVVAVSIEFIEHHQSGSGNIGRVTLFKSVLNLD